MVYIGLLAPIEKMTRTKKLDSILSDLLYVDKRRLNNESVNKPVTIEWLATVSELDCEIWETKSLKRELIDKGLISENEGELHITEKGKNFTTREKGFKQLDKVSNQEDIIREKTIKKFGYDKVAFWISVLAIIIASISLVVSLAEL